MVWMCDRSISNNVNRLLPDSVYPCELCLSNPSFQFTPVDLHVRWHSNEYSHWDTAFATANSVQLFYGADNSLGWLLSDLRGSLARPVPVNMDPALQLAPTRRGILCQIGERKHLSEMLLMCLRNFRISQQTGSLTLNRLEHIPMSSQMSGFRFTITKN